MSPPLLPGGSLLAKMRLWLLLGLSLPQRPTLGFQVVPLPSLPHPVPPSMASGASPLSPSTAGISAVIKPLARLTPAIWHDHYSGEEATREDSPLKMFVRHAIAALTRGGGAAYSEELQLIAEKLAVQLNAQAQRTELPSCDTVEGYTFYTLWSRGRAIEVLEEDFHRTITWLELIRETLSAADTMPLKKADRVTVPVFDVKEHAGLVALVLDCMADGLRDEAVILERRLRNKDMRSPLWLATTPEEDGSIPTVVWEEGSGPEEEEQQGDLREVDEAIESLSAEELQNAQSIAREMRMEDQRSQLDVVVVCEAYRCWKSSPRADESANG
ncbi:unnamed protein product [Chrysoparadoxa australica]